MWMVGKIENLNCSIGLFFFFKIYLFRHHISIEFNVSKNVETPLTMLHSNG